MSKPRWAPRHAKWGPVKPGFWPIWHANKDSLRDNGYSVRKNEDRQWQVRFVPGTYKGWPPVKKPEPIFRAGRHEGFLPELRTNQSYSAHGSS